MLALNSRGHKHGGGGEEGLQWTFPTQVSISLRPEEGFAIPLMVSLTPGAPATSTHSGLSLLWTRVGSRAGRIRSCRWYCYCCLLYLGSELGCLCLLVRKVDMG